MQHIALVHRFVFAVTLFGCLPYASRAADERPNVVLILTDNHGAWTLGCYGNEDIRTPNIDRLALQGTLFTRAFASNPVCSPTRATLLTGLVPSQHGVHCFLSGGRLQVGPQARCTLDAFTSLPEILRDEGYACGLVGKWHLGDNVNPQEGLDDYWITMPHGGTSTFYDAQIIENGKIRKEPQYLTDFWTDHAVKFIDQQAGEEKPFFLFLAYNGPYALSRLLLREGQNRHAAYYHDKELPSFPREPTHPWQFSNRDFHNNPTSIRRVATEVSGVDDGVGMVMKTLKDKGLDDNTLVIFVADQGWVGGHGGFFGMGDHTRPLTARDGMMQIPMIWRQPGKIATGARQDVMVTNYDFLPTLLSHLGLQDKMPQSPRSPGRDFSPTLKGKQIKDWDNTIFYEFENLRCIRTERYKYVRRHPNGPHELYDLKNDPEEFANLVGDSQKATIRASLKGRLDAFYSEHADPKYDMWQGGGSQTRIFMGVDEELAQHEPISPPPVEEGFTPPKINVPEGFTVELAAAPPLVTHPTLACFDDRGRLFVCNNAGVNLSAEELEEQLPNSIRLLEDTDDDGRFDRSTVFADKMTYPMGGAWHDGALYVASPPYIWRLEDTDDDGVADKRDILVSQFGYTGNAASIHGCFLGPDGRLYWCDGYHGHEFQDEQGNITSKREGSYIFSCKPDGSDVRIHCGGGMDNPVEVDFTDDGDILGTVNILYTRPRVDCLVHWLHGGAYPHRERVLGEVKVTGDLLGPVHRFGHVAVSGAMRYRSGVIDHRWRNNYFVTFFNSGKVTRLQLDRDGSTWRTTQREFLSSDNRDFHPTDVLEDADGSLLVVDTGGWFYRGCPTSQFSKPDVLGAIYRVRRKGMTTQVDPWGKRRNWDELPASQLARTLNDTRHQVRERAVAECAKRGDAIVPTLRSTLARRDGRYRLNTVWALTRLAGSGSEAAKETLQIALDDWIVDVRKAACRAFAVYPYEPAAEKLTSMLKDEAPPVRREAAKALGRLGDSQAVGALLKALPHVADREEDHAVIYALIEINDPGAVRRGLSADHADIQRGALIALDQMDKGALDPQQTAAFLNADDEALRKAALRVVLRRKDDKAWAGAAAKVLSEWLADDASLRGRSDVAVKLAAAFIETDDVGKMIGGALSKPAASPEAYEVSMDAVAAGASLPLHKSWIEPLKRNLNSGNPQTVQRALEAVSSIKTDQFHETLRELGASNDRPALLRVAAYEAMSGGSSRLSDEGFDLLTSLLQGQASPAESTRAAQLIASSSLTKDQLIALAPHVKSAGPMRLRDLLQPFKRSSDPAVAKAFLDAMENSRAGLSLPPTEFSEVVKRYPRELLDRANAMLDRIRRYEQQRLVKLDQLLPLLAKGRPERGREVFFSEKAKCAACHRVGEKGTRVGPDLTTIGANRSSRDLLESIVFPSASLVRDYEPYTIVTVGGRVFNGLIARQTGDMVHIQQQSGETLALPAEEIEEIVPSTVSIMPNGLEKALTEADLADVVAYLRSLNRTN